VSSVGGPIQIDIVASREGTNDVQSYSLVKNPDNGLWWGTVSFSDVGDYKLLAKSVDGAGNNTERELNKVKVIAKGGVTGVGERADGAEVNLYFQEQNTKNFSLWDAKAYGQENPQKTDKNGEYFFYVPPGTYYMEINYSRLKKVRTNIFKVEKSSFITEVLEMDYKSEFHLGPINITLPGFLAGLLTQPIEVDLSSTEANVETQDNILGTELPFVQLNGEEGVVTSFSLHGKPTVLTYLSTWYPQTSEQLGFLEALSDKEGIRIVPVMLNDSLSQTTIFKRRGGYGLDILADSDGVLVAPLNIKSLPTHVFLDRKGIVKAKKVGILTKDEILDTLVD